MATGFSTRNAGRSKLCPRLTRGGPETYRDALRKYFDFILQQVNKATRELSKPIAGCLKNVRNLNLRHQQWNILNMTCLGPFMCNGCLTQFTNSMPWTLAYLQATAYGLTARRSAIRSG